MPHQRPRTLLAILEKRLAHFPVVGVLGARQTGKSTLLRELLKGIRTINYVTLDREENRALAARQPSLFVEGLESDEIDTVCIDEIQKVPVLFDTLKAEVDEVRRPGRFAISGSTEFSKKTGIQESLTGRVALLRMFPLNIQEITHAKARHPLAQLPGKIPSLPSGASLVPMKTLVQWFERGGMPGVFAVRDTEARESMFENWLETTCTRDLAQFQIPRFNPELARRIWLACARLEIPNRTEIARSVGKTPVQIERYLEGFKSLFTLYEVEPYRTSVGKSWFYPFDAGIARASGSSPGKCSRIWFLNECLSQFANSGKMRPDLFRYETSRGSKIDFVVETRDGAWALQWSDEESPGTYSLRAAEAFTERNPGMPVLVLAPCKSVHRLGKGITIVPWNAVV